MGKNYLGRDHDELLKRFIEIDLQVFINKIQVIYFDCNFEELSRVCDSLSSSSAYVGAVCCKEICERINGMLKNKKVKEIDEEIKNLFDHAEALEKAFKDYLNHYCTISSGENHTLYSNANANVDDCEDKKTLRIKPPKRMRSGNLDVEKEDDIDLYHELNKGWKCCVI